ncbi:uncharacterized protein LOC133822681 [Humulus lupulus]|uniref:uncharacterized protein LOC133822681 n=1 Tax=Humulus lupulus TaxID=3486 RepID=UPI002B40A7BE|nr:uncharacterized protein LOC133822681 [Humulus lupulus]
MEASYEGSSSYYSVLGVGSDSSAEEIRRAYRKLAMQWHPDRWTRCPSLLGEAKRKFQKIQEAYSVLSDKRKRTVYDAGLYDPNEEEDEGFSDFVQEMVFLMSQTRREEKSYSLEELQDMLVEMAKGFETPTFFCGSASTSSSSSSSQSSSVFEGSGCSKRTRFDPNPMVDRGFGVYAYRA